MAGLSELAKLEEEYGDVASVREPMNAVANVPPCKEKDDWRRYIYPLDLLCGFMKVANKDLGRALQVY
jgi:hypothetical protein